jgi:endonuclease YncB( thermonuclease family)
MVGPCIKTGIKKMVKKTNNLNLGFMFKAAIWGVFVVFFTGLVSANIYFWTDEEGVKHFTNISPPLDEEVGELEESNAVFQKLSAPGNDRLVFRVLKVFDGDTIKVKGLDLVFKIRLVGIDSPETGYGGDPDQPFGQKAKQHLARLLDNRNIFVKSYGIGGYNRQLAEVFVAGRNINLEMIRAGLAEVYPGRRPKTLDSKLYLAEESKARRSKRGMWIQGRAYKRPRQWRKEHPWK